MSNMKTKRKENMVEWKTVNQVWGLSGCKIKGFGMAYYTVPCGLITTVFSLTLSSLVAMPNLRRGGLSNYTTIVKLEVRTKQKNKKKVQEYFHTILVRKWLPLFWIFKSSIIHSFQVNRRKQLWLTNTQLLS